MSRRIPPETAAKVRALYDIDWPDWIGRYTVAELARGFKISPASVRRILNGPEPPPIDAPLSVAEVARLVKASPATVRGWIRNGQLAASNIGTTRPRFVITREALGAFLKARQPDPPQVRKKPNRTNGFKRY